MSAAALSSPSKRLSLETSVEVVTSDFPTCWGMEAMDNGSVEDGEDETVDVYIWYIVAL